MAFAPLIDSFGRVHDNLRISVTDRCNIRCFYCMPETDVQFVKRSEILDFEEIERFARIAVKLGIRPSRAGPAMHSSQCGPDATNAVRRD